MSSNKNPFPYSGLSTKEVESSREKYGKNIMGLKKEKTFLFSLWKLFKEPMIILLFIASGVYFISGEIGDGLFLSSAIIIVAFISLFQDSRSKNALQKLQHYNKANAKVLRNNQVESITQEEIVIGDLLVLEEGSMTSADSKIIYSHDFSLNESMLTGESLAIYKDKDHPDPFAYLGCMINSGLAITEVQVLAANSKLGKIGKSLESIQEEKTRLELQINSFVKKMAIGGAIVFLLVWAINFYLSREVLDSLLKALTLAMSILPEEIPVAFTSFMAIGAMRLMKSGIIVKQMKTVESLGSASVICTDKTGTLTENKMSLAKLYSFQEDRIIDGNYQNESKCIELIRMAMFASEPNPFDPMEIALHQAYEEIMGEDERLNFDLSDEYALGGKPPMMTHIFKNKKGELLVAAKGAPEAIIAVSNLDDISKSKIISALKTLSIDGYRVLGLARGRNDYDKFPEKQQDIEFEFLGLIAFYDPPKENISRVLKDFYKAGIEVKIITGDNLETTTAIAKQVAFKNYDKSISGDALMLLNEQELKQCVVEKSVFVRMFPEAKLKIINALKNLGYTVAMTGDGVNDGPALKAANIGIAMGKRGSELAKQAASLILVEDDLYKMVEAIALGRRIYSNLKKAIQYIISIHIPIILTVFVPLALAWKFPNIFSPIHIIFLELLMGPTCSIIYENEPIEANTMLEKPRPASSSFFSKKELGLSVIQGLVISIAALAVYQIGVYQGLDEASTRTMIFSTLIFANIFLTLVNRSFYFSLIECLKYKNKLVPIMISVTLVLFLLLLIVSPIREFFELAKLSLVQIITALSFGFVSVIWFEAYKWIQRRKQRIS